MAMGRVFQLAVAASIWGIAAPAAAMSAAPVPRLADPIIDAAADAAARARVDPLTINNDDFLRMRDPALWRDLMVERIGFVDGATGWRLWRIANRPRPAGPLWIIPHDDENAAFLAAILAVHSWGGVVMAVDAGARDSGYSARFSEPSQSGERLDPNRVFGAAQPLYTATMLADRLPRQRLIVALHTNARGYDAQLPRCPGEPLVEGGAGDVSMALCTDRMTPRRPAHWRWPFDDDDTLALLPHRADRSPTAPGWCEARLAAAGFNLVDERVPFSDGSASNYAVLHDIAYINFETRDRGNDGAGLAEGRQRLIAMIDRAMALCAPVTGVDLHPFRR
ncbi:MAG: hypothetical protein ACRCSO_04560 [Sphingomonas sp.]